MVGSNTCEACWQNAACSPSAHPEPNRLPTKELKDTVQDREVKTFSMLKQLNLVGQVAAQDVQAEERGCTTAARSEGITQVF
jgi:hypothetical protein